MTKKVLIVDGEANTVTTLEFLMQQAGYRVDVARSEEEALAKVSQFVPDLILLDVMLPGINGFTVLQHVRQAPTQQGVAVIMLAAKGRDVEIDKGLALGADACVIKPFSTRELLAMVSRCLQSV